MSASAHPTPLDASVEVECAVLSTGNGVTSGGGLRLAIAHRPGRRPVRSLPLSSLIGRIGWVAQDGFHEHLHLPAEHPERRALVDEILGPGLVVTEMADVRAMRSAAAEDGTIAAPVDHWILWSEAENDPAACNTSVNSAWIDAPVRFAG